MPRDCRGVSPVSRGAHGRPCSCACHYVKRCGDCEPPRRRSCGFVWPLYFEPQRGTWFAGVAFTGDTHRPKRLRAHGSLERGACRVGQPSPIEHLIDFAHTPTTAGRRAPSPGGECFVGSVPVQARCGACGSPTASRHAERRGWLGVSECGECRIHIDRRPSLQAGATGRRPDMRSPARPPARILRPWPATRHPLPHRLRLGASRLSPRAPPGRQWTSRFRPSAGIPECRQRGPQLPWLRPCESSVTPAIFAPSATPAATPCLASGAKHRRLGNLGSSKALS